MALLLDSNEYSFHFYNQEDENNIAILISLSVLKLSIDPFKDSTENIFAKKEIYCEEKDKDGQHLPYYTRDNSRFLLVTDLQIHGILPDENFV